MGNPSEFRASMFKTGSFIGGRGASWFGGVSACLSIVGSVGGEIVGDSGADFDGQRDKPITTAITPRTNGKGHRCLVAEGAKFGWTSADSRGG